MKQSVANKLIKEINALQNRSKKLTELVLANIDSDFLTPIKTPKPEKVTLAVISKEEFNALPVLERRVLIAQDVLAALKAKKIVEEQGIVLDVVEDMNDGWGSSTCSVSDGKSVKDAIDKAPQCHVCAKGAVIFSLARKFNTIKGRSISTMYEGKYYYQDELDTKKIFGVDLWNELEARFEGHASHRNDNLHKIFGTDDSDYVDEMSIEDLMKNLVRNKGKLKVDGKLIG